ncbi:olfactory receptor 6C4-like [Tiliqua scincoides]|uniref:olfactory receptor 6C4-like n=1 Tax=Tiliqua scincoides TaxID=71010 RepID=UPI003462B3EE
MQVLLFFLLLLVYLLSLTGNLVIITVTLLDPRLHTPMYYFLRNFSMVEIGFISNSIPNMLRHLLSGQKVISAVACFAQLFFVFFLGIMEFCLLGVMAVDRYVAVCHPFQYLVIMNDQRCLWLVLGCWLISFLFALPLNILITRLPLCGPNTINHFMCDSGPLISMACSNTWLINLIDLILATATLFGTLVIVVASYIKIILTVLHLPSAKDQSRAFSTCSSHFLVVSMLYGSCIFAYIQPEQQGHLDFNKEVSVLNMVVIPLLNSFIYSLRNKTMQEALKGICDVKQQAVERALGQQLTQEVNNRPSC